MSTTAFAESPEEACAKTASTDAGILACVVATGETAGVRGANVVYAGDTVVSYQEDGSSLTGTFVNTTTGEVGITSVGKGLLGNGNGNAINTESVDLVTEQELSSALSSVQDTTLTEAQVESFVQDELNEKVDKVTQATTDGNQNAEIATKSEVTLDVDRSAGWNDPNSQGGQWIATKSSDTTNGVYTEMQTLYSDDGTVSLVTYTAAEGNEVNMVRSASESIDFATQKELDATKAAQLVRDQGQDTLIQDNTDAIAENVKDIQTNKKSIETNTANDQLYRQQADVRMTKAEQELYSTTARSVDNSRRLDKVEGRVSALEKDVDTVKKSLASMAAIAGLVEPRYAGDTTISVGIAHASGYEAIALGATHNFSENVAVKAAAGTDSRLDEITATASVGWTF